MVVLLLPLSQAMDNGEFNNSGGGAVANSGYGGSGGGGGAYDGGGSFLWRPHKTSRRATRGRRNKRHRHNQPVQDDERAAQ
jgi:hypothetical protein